MYYSVRKTWDRGLGNHVGDVVPKKLQSHITEVFDKRWLNSKNIDHVTMNKLYI